MTSKLIAALALLACTALQAQTPEPAVAIKDAWVRTTVKGQMSTGAFMTLTARDGSKLVAVSTPVAGVAEVHAMKMDGDVMTMRAVQGGLDLPAGKPVALTPSGYHIMLMDLKAALPKDASVPLTLVFKNARGVESKMELKLPVAAVAPAGAMGAGDAHKH